MHKHLQLKLWRFGVDIVVGTQDREKMLGYIEEFRKERQPINAVRNIMKTRV